MKIFMTLMMTMLMGTFAYGACEIGVEGKCNKTDCEALNTKASGATTPQYTFQGNKCIAVKEASETKCPDIVNNKGKSSTDVGGTTTADDKDTKGK